MISEQEYAAELQGHYQRCWDSIGEKKVWRKGPYGDLPAEYCVLKYPFPSGRAMVAYATCCMSVSGDPSRVELHVFSPSDSDEMVELLTVIAHFHRTGARLDLGHTVNQGKGWMQGSSCDYGIVSLPYLDGPNLENANIDGIVKCYWLIAITRNEVEYKKKYGLEALERKFEEKGFEYLNPGRSSVV